MSWSAGSFTRARGASEWQNDAASLVGIEAGLHDTSDNDLASGINACLNKNGQNSPTVDISMGGFKFTNVGVATATTHFATLGQVQNGVGVYCGLGSGSANAQTATATPAIASAVAGQRFSYTAAFTNTGPTTLNINGTGDLPLFQQEEGSPINGDLVAGNIVAGLNYEVLSFGGSYLLLNPTLGAWKSYVSTHTGFSSNPGYLMYYKKVGRTVTVTYRVVSNGTSNATGYTITAPFTSRNISNMTWTAALALVVDNSAFVTTAGQASLPANSDIIALEKAAGVAWTASNGKAANFTLIYEAAA